MVKVRINAGDLRHRVTVQEQVSTKNDFGEKVDTWADVWTSRVAIYPITAREFFAARNTNYEVTHKVYARYMAGIKPGMRISFGYRQFHIESVINFEERGAYLQLLCKELVS